MKPMPTMVHVQDKPDWSRADALTDEQIAAAAWAAPDARPMTDEQWSFAKKVPRVTIIRRALKLSPEAFSARYRIPLDVVQDWEAGWTAPDAMAQVYLRVIATMPEAVQEALVGRGA
jgi:putative transcriptional regulator